MSWSQWPTWIHDYGPPTHQGLPYEPYTPWQRLAGSVAPNPTPAGISSLGNMTTTPGAFPIQGTQPMSYGQFPTVARQALGRTPPVSAGTTGTGWQYAAQGRPGGVFPSTGSIPGERIPSDPNMFRGVTATSGPGSTLSRAGSMASRVARGRIGPGLAIGVGGAALADQMSEGSGKNALSAASSWGGPAAFLGGGGIGLATAGGVGLGTLIGENLPGNEGKRLSNVSGNIFGRDTPDLLQAQAVTDEQGNPVDVQITGGTLGALEASGVSATDIVKWLGEARDNDIDQGAYMASQLARRGAAGAEFDEDGKVKLSGNAGDFIKALGNSESDDPTVQFLRDAATNNLDDEAIQSGLAGIITAQSQDADKDQQLAQAQGNIQALATQRQMEQDIALQDMAMRETAMAYMAPVTGQMRQEADQAYAMMEEAVAALPEQYRGPALAEAAASRNSAMQMASAYEAQIQMLPDMSRMAQYNQMRDSFADQMQQQLMSQVISGQVQGTQSAGVDLLSGLMGDQSSSAITAPNQFSATPGASMTSPTGSTFSYQTPSMNPLMMGLLPPPGSPLAGPGMAG